MDDAGAERDEPILPLVPWARARAQVGERMREVPTVEMPLEVRAWEEAAQQRLALQREPVRASPCGCASAASAHALA